MRKLLAFLAMLSMGFSQMGTTRYGQVSGQDNNTIETAYENPTIFENIISLEEAINPETYILGPGDQLGINIISTQSILLTIIVNPSGDVLIPNIGILPVAGISLKNAIDLIEQKTKKVFKNSIVYVSLVSIREFLIQIHGAVNKPGFISISPITRLSEIINQSGGFHQFARENEIKVYHKNTYVKTLNYLDYLRTGDITNNPVFTEGDYIFVEYGNIEQEGIVIRGQVSGTGYDIFEPGETVSDIIKRRIRFKNEADLSSITITRKNESGQSIINLDPEEYTSFTLQANDVIDILSENNVMVNGYVKYPGGYKYFPGFKAIDYINLAGGNTLEGDVDKSIIIHKDGKEDKGKDASIERGDIIVVNASTMHVLKGDQSVIQMVSILSSLLLTFIAATK